MRITITNRNTGHSVCIQRPNSKTGREALGKVMKQSLRLKD